MFRSLNRLPVLATMLVLTTTALPALAQEAPSLTGTRLDINAQAQVKAKPDVATFTAGVVTKAATAEAARLDNAKKMQAVFASLKEKKIAEGDMQTSGLTINPDYVYAEGKAPTISGYQAVNTLTLRVRDMDKISDVIDALIKNGINQMNGPMFSIDQPEPLMNKARQEAIQKARARAELYANATGLKIKRIIAISENANMGNPIPYPMYARAGMMKAEAADATTQIAPGQVDLDVTVNVSYELAP